MSGPVGSRLEGVVGPVAHGGHCVLRQEDGPVVFVRHTLPGERVVVQITEGAEGDRFWRGDAVEVLEASPDRVEAPCRFAGPGLCGGCDLQHVRLPAQRALKAGVVREQMVRLAGLEVDVEVERHPAYDDLRGAGVGVRVGRQAGHGRNPSVGAGRTEEPSGRAPSAG